MIVAHRGAPAHAPENTLGSYRAAMAAGAVIAETDVHMTGDGHVVVIHDATTDRTTGVAGRVAAMSWEQLTALDAGQGERLPELGELLDLLRGNMQLCLELKAGVGLVPAVVERIDARGMRGDIIIFTFDPVLFAEARAAMPDVPALYLTRPFGETYTVQNVADAVALSASAIGFSHRFLPREIVDAAHVAGLPVFTWTVNTPEDALRMREWGVDGIITDDPAMVRATLSPR